MDEWVSTQCDLPHTQITICSTVEYQSGGTQQARLWWQQERYKQRAQAQPHNLDVWGPNLWHVTWNIYVDLHFIYWGYFMVSFHEDFFPVAPKLNQKSTKQNPPSCDLTGRLLSKGQNEPRWEPKGRLRHVEGNLGTIWVNQQSAWPPPTHTSDHHHAVHIRQHKSIPLPFAVWEDFAVVGVSYLVISIVSVFPYLWRIIKNVGCRSRWILVPVTGIKW